jgi:hypothetical protein
VSYFPNSKKWGFGIGGTILLAIFSNAIWEYIIEPSSNIGFRWLLNISTLGVTKFKDQLYSDIAKGMHEDASMQLYILFIAFLSAFLILSILKVFIYKHLQERGEAKEPSKVFRLLAFLNRNKVFYYFSIAYLIFAVTFFILTSARLKYVNRAVTHYNQLINILASDIPTENILIYNSRFAQIQNKDDYVRLIHELKGIAVERNKKVPNFEFTF